MPTLTPEEITSREFLVALRGYDRDEVDSFLEEIAGTIRNLQSQLEIAQTGQAHPQPPGNGQDVEREPSAGADPKPFLRDLGQTTQRIVEAAYESAAEIQRRARSMAERELADARSQAAKLVAEGKRRREVIEGLVEMLEERRAALAEDLQGVAKIIEQILADFAPREEFPSSDELLAEARTDAPGERWEPVEGEDAGAGPGSTGGESGGESAPAAATPPAVAEPVADTPGPAETASERTELPEGGGRAGAAREAPATQTSLDVRLA